MIRRRIAFSFFVLFPLIFWFLVSLLIFASPLWAQDHTATVAAAKAQLVAAHVNLQGPCGAYAITKRVAWQLRSEQIGLIHKRPEQNGCNDGTERYAVDALAYPDGRAFDLLINAETENIPAWNVTGAVDPSLWRAPVNPGDIDPPPPNDDIPAILKRLTALEAVANQSVRAIAELNAWVERLQVSVTGTGQQLAELRAGVDVLAARPIYTRCRAAANLGFARIPVSCSLER